MDGQDRNSENQKRVFLVTGATGAIGGAIAHQLAKERQHEVVLIGRDKDKTETAVRQIIRETGNENVRYEIVDLSLQKPIQALASDWQGPLHVLINNAAATPRQRQESADGIELQFATNVMGYFWMIQAFRDILIRSAPARVINVASYWAGDLDLSDLEFKRRPYDNQRAYRQSKQANRMLTLAFADQLHAFGVTVNACHPGDVNSKLSNNLGFGGHESAADGARTPAWLATDRFTQDLRAVTELYQTCLAYC